MDAEAQGKREGLRAPEKDGEMVKRYGEREEKGIVKTKDWSETETETEKRSTERKGETEMPREK